MSTDKPGQMAELKREFRLAIEGVERRGYTMGFWYGLLCGVLTTACTGGLLMWLWAMAEAALNCPNC